MVHPPMCRRAPEKVRVVQEAALPAPEHPQEQPQLEDGQAGRGARPAGPCQVQSCRPLAWQGRRMLSPRWSPGRRPVCASMAGRQAQGRSFPSLGGPRGRRAGLAVFQLGAAPADAPAPAGPLLNDPEAFLAPPAPWRMPIGRAGPGAGLGSRWSEAGHGRGQHVLPGQLRSGTWLLARPGHDPAHSRRCVRWPFLRRQDARHRRFRRSRQAARSRHWPGTGQLQRPHHRHQRAGLFAG